MPPPNGSPSISVALSPSRAAVTARAQASVDAPAAAPATHHRHGERGPPRAFRRVGELLDEPALGLGQPQHVFRADLDRLPPDIGRVLVPADEHHPAAAREPAAPWDRVVAHQDEGRLPPRPEILRRAVVDLRLRSGRRAESQQIVEEVDILRHDQRYAVPLSASGESFPRQGSGHDLHPFSQLLEHRSR